MNSPLKILITSQKGGVGKSTLSANLAAYFAYIAGKKTSLIDFDHQATSGKWVKKAYPIGINCTTVDLPNSKGSGITLLKAKEALRKNVEDNSVVISDLTWTDVLPPEFLFEFDLILVPSSLSWVELDSTMEFINRFSFIFNSRMRNPPKLAIVPSRVTSLDNFKATYDAVFNEGFVLAEPVMHVPEIDDVFGSDYFIASEKLEAKENFLQFCRSVEDLAETGLNPRLNVKELTFQHKVSGSVLDRFRAIRNSSQTPLLREAVIEDLPAVAQIQVQIPSFLTMRDA
jgi:cellulose biosynthesis protein BcsQ